MLDDSTISDESLAVVRPSSTRSSRINQDTGRAQVDLLGHSLGTIVLHSYLNGPAERAANVAHYVNIDGRTASSPPGGVPTLALWPGGIARPPIGGDNVTSRPDPRGAASSEESFVEMYKFFAVISPRTTDVVRDRGWISVAGRT